MKQKSMAMNFKTFNLDNKEYYYIHRHISHFEKDSAIALFLEQKRNGYEQMKKRYMQNYLQNINTINGKSLEVLNASMNEEELISDIDSQLLKVLNDSISDNIQKSQLEGYIAKAYSSLNNFINTKEAKALDQLFAQITAATGLLTSSRKELVALIGKNGIYQQHRDLNKLYYLLQEDLFRLDMKVLTLNQNRLASAERSLTKLVGGLREQKLNKAILQRYLANIFSTQIGEYVVSKGVRTGT